MGSPFDIVRYSLHKGFASGRRLGDDGAINIQHITYFKYHVRKSYMFLKQVLYYLFVGIRSSDRCFTNVNILIITQVHTQI